MNKKTYISFLIGAIFSGIGFYLAFRNVPYSSLMEYIKQVNYWWTLPAAVSLVIAYLVRSIRWQWLLIPGGQPRLTSAYHSLMISMMLNCILPGRIGELARPLVLKKLDGLPLASSLTTLGVERLLDLMALLILLLPTLMLFVSDADTVVIFGNHQLSRDLLINLGYFSLVTTIFLLLLVFTIGSNALRYRVLSWLHHLPAFANRIGQKKIERKLHVLTFYFQDLIERGAQGVKAICHLKGLVTAIFASLAIWGFNALSFYFLSIGSPGIDLSLINICGVMVVICFFIALPSVPGFWGLWEAAGVFALSFFGVTEEIAAGFSLFSHAFNLIPVIGAGWLSSIAIGFRWHILTERNSSYPNVD